MTASVPSVPQRIVFHDPLLDNLYFNINEELYAKQIDRPFAWEEIDGTSVIFIYNTLRFVRHKGSPIILCDVFDDAQKKWRSASSWGFAYPVMWPIKNANYPLRSVGNNLPNCTVGAVVAHHVKKFESLYPQYATDKGLAKKLHHLMYVCHKKWLHRKKKVNSSNSRGAVRFWWSNFVDREVFKTCVSVRGCRSGETLNWKEFADLTAHPELAKIQENVRNLGSARKLLRHRSLDEWAQLSVKDLLDPSVVSVWKDILLQPATVQDSLLGSSSPIWGQSPHNMRKVWDRYSVFKAQRSEWQPRELNMLMDLSVEMENPHQEDPFGVQKQLPLSASAISLYVEKSLRLWRQACPAAYRRWSKGERQNWMQTAQEICQHSKATGAFVIPQTAPFDYIRAYYEKSLLNQAVGECSPSSKKTRKI